tara:strand:- start:48877 stop:49167 length:291 start_codon:yes stop_codon:yes gene_type:complete
MAQQFLHGSQVGPIIEHVGGKRMAELVWSQVLGQFGRTEVFLEDSLDGSDRQSFSAVVNYDGRVEGGILGEVVPKGMDRPGRFAADGTDSLLATLS